MSKLDDVVIKYFGDSGKTEMVYETKHNKRHGKCTYYYNDSDDAVLSVWNYHEGEKHGRGTAYSRDGHTILEINYNHGKRHGEYRSRYDTNPYSIRVHCIYHHDWLHGEYIRCFDNGHKWEHLFYRDGKDITKEVIEEFDINNLTEEDKFLIMIKWGVQCLSWDDE